jgi:hypothetical protein
LLISFPAPDPQACREETKVRSVAPEAVADPSLLGSCPRLK